MESEEGNGTTIKITLPINAENSIVLEDSNEFRDTQTFTQVQTYSETTSADVMSPLMTSNKEQHSTILLVDDDDFNLFSAELCI